jgi:hypothetical protein
VHALTQSFTCMSRIGFMTLGQNTYRRIARSSANTVDLKRLTLFSKPSKRTYLIDCLVIFSGLLCRKARSHALTHLRLLVCVNVLLLCVNAVLQTYDLLEIPAHTYTMSVIMCKYMLHNVHAWCRLVIMSEVSLA